MATPIIPLQDITQPPTQLHIASLIAHVRQEQLALVREWLLQQPQQGIGIEIHAESPLGKLVIVTESSEEKAIVNLLDELREQKGVLNAALVYHEYLSAHDLRDEPLCEDQAL